VASTLWRTVSLYSARSKSYYLLLFKNTLLLASCQVALLFFSRGQSICRTATLEIACDLGTDSEPG
jgi:hypothetical protein